MGDHYLKLLESGRLKTGVSSSGLLYTLRGLNVRVVELVAGVESRTSVRGPGNRCLAIPNGDPATSSATAAAIEMTQQGHKIAFSMETFHPAPYNEETTSVVASKDGYIACEYDSIVGRHRDWAGDNNNTVCVTHIRLVEHGPLVMLTARWSCSQPVIDREPDRITEASPA